MYDSHVHSQYSMDSTADMEDSVRKAIEENMKSICFTDHVDFDSTINCCTAVPRIFSPVLSDILTSCSL